MTSEAVPADLLSVVVLGRMRPGPRSAARVDDQPFAGVVDVGAALEQLGAGDAEVMQGAFHRAGQFCAFTREMPALCGLADLARRPPRSARFARLGRLPLWPQ